ncbi:Uncharacterised protein [Serratia quinivorans]|nr:Uncharacterised protein [Serratia quinivorans]
MFFLEPELSTIEQLYPRHLTVDHQGKYSGAAFVGLSLVPGKHI